MLKALLKAAIADAVLALAAYFVQLDLGRRAAYAASPHSGCVNLCSYNPTFGYGAFIQFFTMAGHGVTLTSPPTLDWIQVIAALLVIVNGWFLYDVYVERRGKGPLPFDTGKAETDSQAPPGS